MTPNVLPFEIREPYLFIDSIAASQTTPAATARDAVSIEALSNAIIYTVDAGVAGLDLRFSSDDSNNETIVLDVLHARDARAGQDHYTRAATLTLTVGQQTASTSGYTYVDTAVVSNDATDQEVVAISPTGDYTASVLLNTNGYGRYAIVATTLGSGKVVRIDAAKLTYRHAMLKS